MKRKLKVGLVGLMTTPFRGDKENQYAQSATALAKLAEAWGFELYVVEEGIYSEAQAIQAAVEMQEKAVDFLLLQASSFSGGAFIYPFAKLDARLGLWGVPEGAPTAEGGLPLNSFTAVNMYNSILKTYLTEYKKLVKWFFGKVEDVLFNKRFKITLQALTALVNLKDAKIALVGGVAPGFDNLGIDERHLFARLGVKVIPIEFDQVMSRVKNTNERDLAAAKAALKKDVTKFDSGLDEAFAQSAAVYAAFKRQWAWRYAV